MRNSFLKLISCVLLLAMLAVPMTAFATGSDIADGDVNDESEAQADTTLYFTYNKEYDADYHWRHGNTNGLVSHGSGAKYHASEQWDGILLAWSPNTDTMYDTDNYAYNNLTAVQFCPASTGNSPYNGVASITSIASTGAEYVAVQLDLKYDSADSAFDGFVFDQNIRSGGLAKVKADGTFVTYDSTGAEIAIGTLKTGWNTLTAWYIPSYDDANVLNGYNVYFAIGAMDSVTSTEAFATMPHTTFSTTKKFAEHYSAGMMYGNDKLAGATGTFSLKCFMVSSISTTDVKPLSFDTIDEWVFADNAYVTDLANSSISEDGTYLLKADGTRDLITWTAPDAATYPDAKVSLSDGVLTFSGANRQQFKTAITPGKMENNTLNIGPTILTLEFYIAKDGLGDIYFSVNGKNILIVQENYPVLNAINGTGSWVPTERDGGAGWYTVEYIMIPQTSDGIVCTMPGQAVAQNKVYMRAYKSSSTPTFATDPISLIDLNDSTKWKSWNEGASFRDHFVSLEDKVVVGRNSGTADFKIRNVRTANLVGKDLTTATFSDYISIGGEQGSVITLPTYEDVAVWVLDGQYYLPGSEFILNENVTFSHLTNRGTNLNPQLSYSSDTVWGSTVKKEKYYTYNTGEGWGPIVGWHENEAETNPQTYEYDADNKILSIKGSGNNADFFMESSHISDKTFEKTDNRVYAFDVQYTAGAFSGFTTKLGSYQIMTASTAGEVKFGETVLGNLNEGWNSVHLYFILNEAGTAYTVYCALNDDDPAGNIDPADFATSLPAVTWSNAEININSRMYVYNSTPDVALKFKSFRFFALIPDVVSYVNFGDTAEMMTTLNGAPITLPSPENVAYWTDGENYYKIGSQYEPTSLFTTLTPLSEDESAELAVTRATFVGYTAVNGKKGSTITLPVYDDVAAWVLNGRYYLPGSDFVLYDDVTFTHLTNRGTNLNSQLFYNSDSAWGNTTADESAYSYNTGDGHSPVVGWYKDSAETDPKVYVYDPVNKTISIAGAKNNIDIFMGSNMLPADFKAIASRVYSFDVQYTKGAFSGFAAKINWGYQIMTATTAGEVKLGNTVVGNLNEGWNKIHLYFILNEEKTAYTIYCTLNAEDPAVSIDPADLTSMPSMAWTGTAINDARMQIYNTTSDISLTCKSFRFFALYPDTIGYVNFGDAAEMMTTINGASITLPSLENVAYWTDGENYYKIGSQYTPTAGFTTLAPVSESEAALLNVKNATEKLQNATTDQAIAEALDELLETLANPNLDITHEDYLAAVKAKDAAIAALNTKLTDALAAIDPSDATNHYNTLVAAIIIYNDAKAYISDALVAQLTEAIDSYNLFVDQVNADVAEATTVAAAVTVAKLPSPEILAMVADIRSKVGADDEE